MHHYNMNKKDLHASFLNEKSQNFFSQVEAVSIALFFKFLVIFMSIRKTNLQTNVFMIIFIIINIIIYNFVILIIS